MLVFNFLTTLKFSKGAPFTLRNTCAITFLHCSWKHSNQNLSCMAAEPGTLLCSTVTRQKTVQRQVFVTQGPENQQTFPHGFLLLPGHIL